MQADISCPNININTLTQSSIRYGLVVRIPGSHPGGPGSIPGNGTFSFGSFCCNRSICRKKKKITTKMGFEPTRAEPIGLAVQRLNHSAPSSLVEYWLLQRVATESLFGQ